MTDSPPRSEDIERWGRFVEAYRRYADSSRDILSPGVNRASLIRSALGRGGVDKFAAMHILPRLTADEVKTLFDLLLDWCVTGHAVSHVFRKALLTLPREWLLERVEGAAEPLLDEATDEEYRRLFDLYVELDRELASGLARRAAEHGDPDISDTGRDFLDRLTESEGPDTPGDQAEPGTSGRTIRRILG